MISVAEAEKQILAHTPDTQSVSMSIEDISNEVLRQPLLADRCQPPFHRVAMDGIAINFDSWKNGRQEFSIEGCQAAGQEQKILKSVDNCLEVMTGSVLPEGCNAVIRVEDIKVSDGKATIDSAVKIEMMQNVHQLGSDHPKGFKAVASDSLMHAPNWAIAASIGQTTFKVSKRPKIAVVSTGNELVNVDETPKDFQIRRSNSYAISACLKSFGFHDVKSFHLQDDVKQLHNSLSAILKEYDTVILSGGVSMGKFDFIPQVLADLRVEEKFHKVKQRPGKPLWFGISEDNKAVFGLPGNPVSSLTCTRRYVVPALQKSLLAKTQTPYAILTDDFSFKKSLAYFLPVTVSYSEAGQILATPKPTNGSGDYSSLSQSDGFVELPEEQSIFPKGSAFPLYLWGS